MTAPDAPGRRPAGWRLAGIGLLALGVAAALYVAGRLHQPDYTFSMFGTDPIPPQVAAGDHRAGPGRGPGAARPVDLPQAAAGSRPAAAGPDHAPGEPGFALFALTVPVAVHCLIVYGVQLTSPRAAIHSIAGCFFYGAFAAKVLLVHGKRLPGWALPVAGGTLAIVIGVLWYTSALWYYNGYQLPLF